MSSFSVDLLFSFFLRPEGDSSTSNLTGGKVFLVTFLMSFPLQDYSNSEYVALEYSCS